MRRNIHRFIFASKALKRLAPRRKPGPRRWCMMVFIWAAANIFSVDILTAQQLAEQPFIPPVWLQSDSSYRAAPWIRDRNANHIDDIIDALPNSALIDIVVDLRRYLAGADITSKFQGYIDPGAGEFPNFYVGGRVSFVFIPKVQVATIRTTIVNLPEVFLIEFAGQFVASADISVKNIKVKSSPSYEGIERYNIRGRNIPIAVLDTGVEENPCIPASRRMDPFPGPPGDACGHGSVVASIIMGNDLNMDPNRSGIAPEAKLIDVKALAGAGTSTGLCYAASYGTVAAALEWIIAQGEAKIVNLSFSNVRIENNAITPLPHDGEFEAFNHLVNYAVSRGMVCVASAGNFGERGEEGLITSPGIASRAITVGAYLDKYSIDRTDDVWAPFSSFGPLSRGVFPEADETLRYKPDLVAPGAHTYSNPSSYRSIIPSCPPDRQSFYGTSIAAAHVSGVAALILEYNPTITPEGVKDLLMRSAEKKWDQRLHDHLYLPYNGNPNGWNESVGHGFLDAMRALQIISAEGTDLTFPYLVADRRRPYFSSDIKWNRDRRRVRVYVQNQGSRPATNVYVEVGIRQIGIRAIASGIPYQHIDTKYKPRIEVGDTTSVEVEIPFDTSTRISDGSLSIEAEIRYGADSNFRNNQVSHNEGNILVDISESLTKPRAVEDSILTVLYPFLTFAASVTPVSLRFRSETWDPSVRVTLSPSSVNASSSEPPDTVKATIKIPRRLLSLNKEEYVYLTAIKQNNELYGGMAVKISTTGANSLPRRFELYPNFPNPFSKQTQIRFATPRSENITLQVYNLLGQRIRSLFEGNMEAGQHTMTWNGTDESGKRVAPGIYFYRLRGEKFVQSKKMVFLHETVRR